MNDVDDGDEDEDADEEVTMSPAFNNDTIILLVCTITIDDNDWLTTRMVKR